MSSLVEALQRSPMASWVCERGAFAIVASNPAAVSLLGRPPADVAGKSMRELWVDPPKAEAEFLAAARVSRFATWLQGTSDAGAVEVKAAVIPVGEGAEAGWLVQVASVRPAATRAPSREILDRLGALLDHATEGIALVTGDGITEYGNAVQAIPEGRIEENTIRVRLHSDGRDRVVLEVSDTGLGIPESVVGHIFDPFFTTKPVGVGTGLGLFICHGIVKSMHGDIAVETQPGRGTTFRVTLPVAGGDVAAKAVPADERPAPINRMRILIIDDEEAIGRVLVHLLGRDHDVVVDRRASDALALLQKGASFDVVLCDVMMPGMSGTEFYEKLADVAPEIAPRVVFLTGGAFTAATRDFLERVPNLRLEKPFDIKTLQDAIQAAGSMRSRSA
jgi:CheY-like chemotaxis protein